MGGPGHAASVTRAPTSSTTRTRSPPTRTTRASCTRSGTGSSHRRARPPNQNAFENATAFAGDVYLARTTNGGSTWEPARKIFKAGTIAQTIGNLIVVLPDNADLQRRAGRRVHAAPRRQERARTLGAPTSPRSAPPTTVRPGPSRRPSSATSAGGSSSTPTTARPTAPATSTLRPRSTGQAARIYVVWQDSRFGPRSSIALSQSLDGGLTWSSPIRVNQTPPADPGEPAGNNQAFTPMVQVLERRHRGGQLLRLPQQHRRQRRHHPDRRVRGPLPRRLLQPRQLGTTRPG